jgi:uncharacterized protein YlxP (DUF503 family)
VVSSLLGRVKSRFNVSASEVGAQDCHGQAVVGFTVCGSQARILNSVLAHLLNFIEDNAEAQVVDSFMDCARWDDSGDWGDNEPAAPGQN